MSNKPGEEIRAVATLLGSVIVILIIINLLLPSWAKGAELTDEEARATYEDPAKYAVKIRVCHGNVCSLGSGVLIATKVGVVAITNNHVANSPPGRVTLVNSTGSTWRGDLAAFDKPHDLALIRVKNYTGPAARYGFFKGKGLYRLVAFGGGLGFHEHQGYFIGENGTPGAAYGTQVFSFGAHPGDSGGCIINNRHEVVGVIWGDDVPGTPGGGRGTAGKALVELIDKYIKTTQTQCGPGGCQPYRPRIVISPGPFTPPRIIEQPRRPTPAPRPQEDYAGVIKELQERIAALEAKRATAGQDGKDGRDGTDAVCDIDAIVAFVTGHINKRVEPFYIRVHEDASYQPVLPGQYVTLPISRE